MLAATATKKNAYAKFGHKSLLYEESLWTVVTVGLPPGSCEPRGAAIKAEAISAVSEVTGIDVGCG